MNYIQTLSLACVIIISTACVNSGKIYEASDATSLGTPIIREGTIYTPASRSSNGCLLHSVHTPGRQAPAAMVYQSVEGQFSYNRPENCVKGT